jgi:hypothetical protein
MRERGETEPENEVMKGKSADGSLPPDRQELRNPNHESQGPGVTRNQIGNRSLLNLQTFLRKKVA